MLHLSEKYREAVGYAAAAHAEQVRKGTNIPYVSHPIAVSALVVEHGGNEVQAIAALLHDVLEDCGAHHAPVIAERFGSEVLKIVEGLTDGVPDDHGVKPLWRERKELYLAHLEKADLCRRTRGGVRQASQREGDRRRPLGHRRGGLRTFLGAKNQHGLVL